MPRVDVRSARDRAVPALYVAAIAVTGAVLWRNVLTGHAVLVGGDILQTLPPWFQGGVLHPPRNALLADPVSQFVPWLTLVRDAYAHGHLPLWNPTAFSGAPLLADDQSAPFSVFTALALPFTPAVGYSLAMLAKLVIAGLGMYLWLRQLAARALPAILAGVVFATSSFVVVWLGHPQTAVAAIFPWIFAAVEWYLRTRRLGALAAIAIGVALQFLAGHAESTLHLGVLLAVYVTVRALIQQEHRWTSLLAIGGACVAGTALAAVQLVPFAAELGNTNLVATRAATNPGAAHLTLRALATWLIPNGQGNPAIDGALGRPPNYLESAGFVGVGALCLALLAPVVGWRRHRSVVVTLGVAALVLVGVIYGPLTPLVAHLPLLSSANSVRMLVDLCLVLAVLAGLGLDGLLAWEPRRTAPRWLGGGVLGAGIAAVAALAALGLVLAARGAGVDSMLPRIHGQIGFWAVVAMVSALGAVALIGSFFAGAPRQAAASGLAVMALVEGAIFAGPFQPQVPTGDVPPPSAAISWLQGHAGGSAVAGEGLSLIPDTAAFYGLHDARGIDLTIDPRVRLYWSHADPGYTDATYYTVLSRPGTAWLAAAGVRYYVSTPGGAPPGSTPVYRAAAFVISAIPGARPFAFSAAAVEEAPGSAAAVALLARDPLGPVVVEHRGAVPPAGAATVTVTHREAGDVELRVDARHAATITVLQSYAPGWTARVDGTRTAVMPADGLFQAIAVPAGRHVVSIRYEPASVVEGAAVSLAAVVVAVLIGAGGLLLRRRRAGRRPDHVASSPT